MGYLLKKGVCKLNPSRNSQNQSLSVTILLILYSGLVINQTKNFCYLAGNYEMCYHACHHSAV